MVQRTCSLEECEKPVRARGWCKMHYQRWVRHGAADYKKLLAKDQVCKIRSCERTVGDHGGRGWCSKHYSAWADHGDPEYERLYANEKQCEVSDCPKHQKCRGLCAMHYSRWQRSGSTDKPQRKTRKCEISDCGNKHMGLGYCEKHYLKLKAHGNPLGGRTNHTSPEDSFSARTERQGNCVVWLGAKGPEGYGTIIEKGSRTPVHRYAWERQKGPIPDGYLIDHKCFNPSCVNIEHLRIATKAQNNSNKSGPYRSNKSSGTRNVYQNRKSWMVMVQKNGESNYYGSYPTKSEAAVVAEQARKELFGLFAGKG